MFLAFNNGIAATADHLYLDETKHYIKKISTFAIKPFPYLFITHFIHLHRFFDVPNKSTDADFGVSVVKTADNLEQFIYLFIIYNSHNS